MPIIDEDVIGSEERFNSVPDVVDPKLADKLNSVIKQQFGDRPWHIKIYIADDGTGNLQMISKHDSYGFGYSDKEIQKAYHGDTYSDEELLENIVRWKKVIHWHWKKRYPIMAIGYETFDGDEYGVEQRVLKKQDMSQWEGTMIFNNFKSSNKTSIDRVDDDKTVVRDNFYDSQSSTLLEDRIEGEDESSDPIPTDELSVVFSQVYDIWMNDLRHHFSARSDPEIPDHFDIPTEYRHDVVKMVNHYDTTMIKIKEHRAADAGNIDNYKSDFSELHESYRAMKENLTVPSSIPDKEFVDAWNEFKEKMDLLINLLKNYSSIVI